MSPVAVAWFNSVGIAIRLHYVPPVLWMMSHFPTMCRMAAQVLSSMRLLGTTSCYSDEWNIGNRIDVQLPHWHRASSNGEEKVRPFDMGVIAHPSSCCCLSTKFDVDSSSRVTFKAQTYTAGVG